MCNFFSRLFIPKVFFLLINNYVWVADGHIGAGFLHPLAQKIKSKTCCSAVWFWPTLNDKKKCFSLYEDIIVYNCASFTLQTMSMLNCPIMNDEEQNIHGCFHTINHINWICKSLIMIKGPRSQSHKYCPCLIPELYHIYIEYIEPLTKKNYNRQSTLNSYLSVI